MIKKRSAPINVPLHATPVSTYQPPTKTTGNTSTTAPVALKTSPEITQAIQQAATSPPSSFSAPQSSASTPTTPAPTSTVTATRTQFSSTSAAATISSSSKSSSGGIMTQWQSNARSVISEVASSGPVTTTSTLSSNSKDAISTIAASGPAPLAPLPRSEANAREITEIEGLPGTGALPERPAREPMTPKSSTSSKEIIPIVALQVPQLDPWRAPKPPAVVLEDEVDARDLEATNDAAAKVYEQHTGLKQNEPVIIATSEFLPLFEGDQKTSRGKSVSLKENAKIVTAKAAVTALLQVPDTKTAVQENEKIISSFINKNAVQLNEAIAVLGKTRSALDISSYVLSEGGSLIGSFYEILRKGGYSSDNITAFTLTKMWQQSLLETKKSLLSHSPDLLAEGFTRANPEPTDSDPFLLSDIDKTPIGTKRLWINPYYVRTGSIESIAELGPYDKMLEKNVVEFDFSKNQFIDMSRGNPPQLTPQTPRSSLLPTLSKEIMEPYASSGRDISILANALFKEATYSRYLLDEKNASFLNEKYGYQASSTGDNFKTWDHLVGRFSKSVRDVITNPTGRGNSLVSFSQVVTTGPDVFQVLTFEKNYLEEGANSTPGTYYYVDSSFTTSDGRTLDTGKVDDLLGRIRTSHDTTKTIIEMLGYSTVTKGTQFASHELFGEAFQKIIPPVFTLDGIVESLSMTTLIYRRGVRRSRSLGKTVLSFDATRIAPQEQSVRLASLVCKCAVSPTSGYVDSSRRLHTLLFLWVMNLVLQQSDGVSNNGTLTTIQRSMATLIAEGQASVSDAELADAKKEARAIPYGEAIAADVFINGIATSFFGSPDKELWKAIVDAMKDVYESSAIYRKGVNEETTGYSGMSKVVYLYNYFDLMMRIVAAQTPEDLLGKHISTVSKQSYTTDAIGNRTYSQFTESDTYLILGSMSPSQISEMYVASKLDGGGPKDCVKKISDALNYLTTEENTVLQKVAFIRKYLFDLNTAMVSYRNFLADGFKQGYIAVASNVYASNADLTPDERKDLINMSLTDEQIKMTRYMVTEMEDRLSQDADSYAKLKTTSWFKSFPDDYRYFINVNETDLISYTMLSPYFKAEEFQPKKGGNKKIFCVGVPHGLNRSLRSIPNISADSKNDMLQGIVRFKIWKMNSLFPDIIYKPTEFLFELNRFPTRMLRNWSYDSFANDTTNILKIPSKVVTPNGKVLSERDFSDSFPVDLYGSTIPQEDQWEIYSNHAISFLTEEYLRWFTDCRFEETRYRHYGKIQQATTAQLNMIAATIMMGRSTAAPTPSGNSLTYTDPVSGTKFKVPIKNEDSSSGVVGGGLKTQDSFGSKSSVTKTFEIPMNDTMEEFFRNETFFSNPLDYIENIVYPKKFDRTFNLLIDPDDFYVDETRTSPSSIKKLLKAGVLVGVEPNSTSPFKHRDTSSSDVSMDEYFVTMEPYDYSQLT